MLQTKSVVGSGFFDLFVKVEGECTIPRYFLIANKEKWKKLFKLFPCKRFCWLRW